MWAIKNYILQSGKFVNVDYNLAMRGRLAKKTRERSFVELKKK